MPSPAYGPERRRASWTELRQRAGRPTNTHHREAQAQRSRLKGAQDAQGPRGAGDLGAAVRV
jgi:hypothetical protein